MSNAPTSTPRPPVRCRSSSPRSTRRFGWTMLVAVATAACGQPRTAGGGGAGGLRGAGDPSGATGGDSAGGARDEPAEAAGENAFNDVTEPVEGRTYPAGTRIHVETLGVSFRTPDGWSGGVPAGTEVFVLEKQGLEANLFILAVEGAADEARREMAAAIDLGDGVVLQPDGAPEESAGVVKARYAVVGTATPMRGYIAAVIGGYGITVLVAGLAATAAVPDTEAAVDAIVATVGFKDPRVEDATDGSDAGWSDALSGRKLQRFYTGSGYSEHEIMWLCRDGRAARLFDSGGVDTGSDFSTALRSDYAGTWKAYGDDAQGTLELAYNDGTYSSWTLTYEDNKLYLDGGRWYREETRCAD